MKHRANPRFWDCYHRLPADIRRLADESYRLLLEDPKHPSLHFKKVGQYWSVRVGLQYRALAVEKNDFVVWFWIGPHSVYNRLSAGG